MTTQSNMKSSGEKRQPLLVTAAIIRRNFSGEDRLLIAQRKFDSSIEGGKWEFPGGKVDFGEHPEACLVREIKEELDLDIRVTDLFDLSSHVYELADGRRVHVVLLFYLCEWGGGEIKCLDVQDAKWIRQNELLRYGYAAADEDVVRRLATGG